MSLVIQSATVFKANPGNIGKKDPKPAYFVGLVIPEVGPVECSVMQAGLSFVPAIDQKISAVVSGVRDFSGRIVFNLVPASVKPVPPGK